MANTIILTGGDSREGVWNYWRRFESQRNVEKFLSETGRGALTENAHAVSYCVKQASDLYHSAFGSSLLARPLLLFYGMISLLKAVALTNTQCPTNMREIDTTESSGHGLKLVKWPHDTAWAIDDEKILVNVNGQGFFPFIERRLNPISYKDCSGKKFAVKELLGLIPGIAYSYHDYYGRYGSGDVAVSAQVFSGGFLCLLVKYSDPPAETEEEFFERFPNFKGYVYTANYAFNGKNTDVVFNLLKNPTEIPGLAPRMGGGLTVVPPAQGYHLNKISAHYLMMYALSIVARYKVDLWGSLLEGRSSGIGYLIFDFLDASMSNFPMLALEQFVGLPIRNAKFDDPHGQWSRPVQEIYKDLEHFTKWQRLSNLAADAATAAERIAAIGELRYYGEGAPLIRRLVEQEPDLSVRLAAVDSPLLWMSLRDEDKRLVWRCFEESTNLEFRAHALRRLGQTRDSSIATLLSRHESDQTLTSLGTLGQLATDAVQQIKAELAKK